MLRLTEPPALSPRFGAKARVVRDQIGHGADWGKLYGDYRWIPEPGAQPTFSLVEMKVAVETAHSAGAAVAVHAGSAEGMRRAILAGVDTIEHGDGGTPEVFSNEWRNIT
jgi:imidazolonepropionase-like amidohydrolase